MMRHVVRPPSWFHPGSPIRVIDAACGSGVFVAAARQAEAAYRRDQLKIEVWTWDIDPEVTPHDGCNVHHRRSFLDATRDEVRGAIVATNPPFLLADQFARHALDMGAAQVSLLLPLSFRGSDARIPLWHNLAEIAVMHPRITYGGPAREAKKSAREADGRKFADSANGDSAVFTWRPQHVGGALTVDLPAWR
jgi:hypothetical protein